MCYTCFLSFFWSHIVLYLKILLQSRCCCMQGGSPAQNDGQALAAKTIKYEELVNFKKTTTKNPTKQEKNNHKVQVVVSRRCSCTTLELKSVRPPACLGGRMVCMVLLYKPLYCTQKMTTIRLSCEHRNWTLEFSPSVSKQPWIALVPLWAAGLDKFLICISNRGDPLHFSILFFH